MTKQDIAALEARLGTALGCEVQALAKRGGKGYTVLVDNVVATTFPEATTGRELEIALQAAVWAIGAMK